MSIILQAASASDLVEIPAKLSIAEFIFKKSVDIYLDKEVESKILKRMSSIKEDDVGLLFRINKWISKTDSSLYFNPDYLISDFGFGKTPLDVLSRAYSIGFIEPKQPDATYENESIYLWVVKKNTNLSISYIPKELNNKFEKDAKIEGWKIKILEQSNVSSKTNYSLGIYEYWNAIYIKSISSLKDQKDIEKIKTYTEKIDTLERKLDLLQNEYNETLMSIKRINDYNSTIEFLQGITAIAAKIFTEKFSNERQNNTSIPNSEVLNSYRDRLITIDKNIDGSINSLKIYQRYLQIIYQKNGKKYNQIDIYRK